MGFPASAQTTVLTVTATAANGAAERETITLTPSPPQIVSTTLNHIVDGDPVTITPDRGSGAGALRLLNTDASGYNPTGWTYTVQRGTRAPYSVSIPASLGPTVDLADLTPVTSTPGTYDLLIHATDLGGAAALNVGTGAGTVAAGDDSRFGNSSPWRFSIADYGAVSDAVLVHDGAVTGGVAAVTCATSTPFPAGLTGKSILVQGAGPTGVTAFRSTITGRTNSGTVTLADTPPTSITGAIVAFGTNNYAAIRRAAAAAEDYLNGTGVGAASTPHTYAQVYTPPGVYALDGPLDTSKSGNGQVPLGVYPTTGVKKVPDFYGEGSGAGVRHWEQLVPQFGGSCWISFGFYTSTSAQLNDINANGNPGIISGPNEGTGNGLAYGAAARFSNIMPMIRNMAFLVPHTSFGLPYAAWSFFGCANAHVENVSVSTLGVVPGSDYATPGTFGTGLSIGALMPAPGNNDLSVIRNLSIQGGFTYGLFLSEHTIVDRVMVLYCWAGLCPVGSYAGSVGAVHAIKVATASIEACGREVYIIGAGSQGVGPRIDIDQLQTESGTPTFDGNSTAALASAEGRIVLTGLFTPSGVSIAQPSGIELVNGQVPRAITIQTANYAAGPLDRTVLMDTTAGNLTLSLPDADFNPVEYIAKNVGANTLTVAALTSPQQKIYDTSSANSISLAAGVSARLQAKYNGTAWSWYRV
jgi:hypothetical protein